MLLFIHTVLVLFILNPLVLYDFTENSNLEGWFIVNDGVMGGLSDSEFKVNDNGNGLFTGNVSLENNGGFASVHYRFPAVEIKSAKTLVLHVKGDGKRYQARVYASVSDYYSYISYFTTSGQWQTIEIPLTQMYPSFRGRKLDMPNFSSDTMEEIAILIGNKKAEAFALEIAKIELR